MPSDNLPRDARGFAVYLDTVDTRGCRLVVKQSSVADYRGVWLFCTNAAGAYSNKAVDDDVSPHLDAQQARAVAAALLRFADDADAGRW